MKKLFLITALLLCFIPVTVLAMDKASSADESVTLINAFTVPEGKEAEAVVFWEKAADFMRTQPGYISTALHQSILPDAKFELVNVAKWKNAQDYEKATHALQTQSGIKLLDGLIPTRSLYKVIRSD